MCKDNENPTKCKINNIYYHFINLFPEHTRTLEVWGAESINYCYFSNIAIMNRRYFPSIEYFCIQTCENY